MKENGQAAVEMAVFGTLILMAFSALLLYGQRFETQQQVKMEAFRRALQKAYERNGSVTYTYKKDSRFFNLFSGFAQGQSSTLGSTASVMWQKGMPGEQGEKEQKTYAYYVINDTVIGDAKKGLPLYPKTTKDFSGAVMRAWVAGSVWKEEQSKVEEYDSTATKDENPVRIVNVKAAGLKETITTKLYTRVDKSYDTDLYDDAAPLPEYHYDDHNQSYQHEWSTYTVTPLAPVIQGAYYNPQINRVEYSADKTGAKIEKERSWSTDSKSQ